MKRGQLVALIAGATLGVAAVTIGVILAREEGREAARRFLNENQIGQKSQQAAQVVANTAKRVGNQVVVNPDPRLKRIAKRRGWPVQDWSQVATAQMAAAEVRA